MFNDELSRLDTSAAGGGDSWILNGLKSHRLGIHKDVNWTTAKDRVLFLGPHRGRVPAPAHAPAT
jgi:hypothetical protein